MIERLNEALAGRYRIGRKLGEGGMATVFLAEDVKHQRPVAIKVLKPELAAVVGAERFLAEIRTTANLQHPHVLPLHDSGEADGFLFYVMPYIEGESLREKLERERQLPVEEAVEMARKVASALQHAHERGVVHRDVKPANILLSGGEPLVADFGIALAVSSAGGGRITETGLSLGTPHYMSPEQASGDRSLDPRSDVYALGCVLYEMLTGEPPFPGPTPQAVLARILTSTPQRTLDTRHTVPAHVDAAVAKALEKLPADRFGSVAAFRKALEDPDFRHAGRTAPGGAATIGAAGSPGADRSTRSRWIAGGALAALAVLALWGWLRPDDPAPFRRIPTILDGLGADFGPGIAISPDGRRIAHVTEEGEIRLRSLDGEQIRTVVSRDGTMAGGASVRTPFFSPDGASLAYHRGAPGSDELAWVSLGGGSSIRIDGSVFPGGSWGEDGWIYWVRGSEGALYRARPEGPVPERLPQPEGSRFRWPQALPGGERLLVEQQEERGDWRWVLHDIRSGEAEPISGPGVARAWYARYAGGWLFWVDAGFTLLAAPFDPEEAAVDGSPVALATSVQVTGGGAHLALADDGTVLLLAGTSSQSGLGENLVWVSRDGSVEVVEERLAEQIGDFDGLALSPDERYAAVQVELADDTESAQIWIHDLRQGTIYPLTFDGGNEDPEWLPDGRVAYRHVDEDGNRTIRAQPFDRSGGEQILLDPPGGLLGDLEPDPEGRLFVFEYPRDPGAGENTARSIYVAEPGDSASLRPFVDTRFEESEPEISPDGRWLAYVSDESGRDEVYLRSFPDGGRPWPISREGGSNPQWGPDSREILFSTPLGQVRSARLDVGEGGVRVVEETDLFSTLPFELSGWQMSADGERILTIAEPNRGALGRAVILLNVFDELERRWGR